MEKNITEMLKEEKEYFNIRSNGHGHGHGQESESESKNEKKTEWNSNLNRRNSERQTRNSLKGVNTENMHNWSCQKSTKKKIYDQQVNSVADVGELNNCEVEDGKVKNDLLRSERGKRENKSGIKEYNERKCREKLTEQKKEEGLIGTDQMEATKEDKYYFHGDLKRESSGEFKCESEEFRKVESSGEEKKGEKKQCINDKKKEETKVSSISARKKYNEKKQSIFKEKESASVPVSTKKYVQSVKTKYSVLKSLNTRCISGSGSASASASNSFNVYGGSKSVESKKRNDSESSKQHILDILFKRVKCLTSVESTKEYEFNTSVKYRLAHKEGVGMSTNNNKNTNILNATNSNKEAVLLLLTRDFRVNDNWALIYAYEMAHKKKCNLLACTYLNRKEKQYNRYINVKLKILKDLETNMKQLNVPFHILLLYMIDEFVEFVRFSNVKTIVCDFNPLKSYRNFISNLTQIAITKAIKIFQIDAHNIIPAWVTSNEEEMNARTIRTKIKGNLFIFLTDFIQLKPFQQQVSFPEPFDINQAIRKLTIDTSAPALHNFEYTENKALQLLKKFCDNELEKYSFRKNDPNCNTSHMLLLLVSLGILSSQRCALEANQRVMKKPSVNSISGKEAFYDQIIIKKELADNFCYFSRNYDNLEGAEKWARETLQKHENDKREYLYEYEDLRDAKTHDDIWNCSQLQLLKEGIISGHLKFYWAKQILNWTSNPQKALSYAFELYKHYSLGSINSLNCAILMNAILGVHDISCTEKKIVGKIRYMSNSECKKRFNAKLYMSKFTQGVENAVLIQKIPTVTFATYLKKRKRNSDEINLDKRGKT